MIKGIKRLKQFTDIVHDKVVWFQALIFLLIACLLMIKPLSYGMFIDQLGINNLPFVYVLIAVVSIVFSNFYSKWILKKAPLQLLRYSLVASIFILIAIYIFNTLFPSNILSYYTLFIFVSIFGLMTASQFWLSVNVLFEKNNVKRYFGKLGTFAILGGISGGYITSLWTKFFSAETVIFLVIFLLFTAIYVVNRIQEMFNSSPQKLNRQKLHLKDISESPWQLVWNSVYLRHLGFIIFVSVIAAKLIDYEYGYYASKVFNTEEELTSFFGFWFATISIVSLGIQFLLIDKLIGKLGIAKSMFILPAALLFATAALIIFPAILFSTGLKLFEGSLKQTTHKASIELILLPIPQQLKLRTKTFLDVTIDSLATGISGFFILIIINALNLPNVCILFILTLLLMAWIFGANKIRKEYIKSFRLSLKLENPAEFEDNTIIKTYQKIFKNGDLYTIKKTLRSLTPLQVSQLSDSIIELCQQKNNELIALAIDKLYEIDKDYGIEIAAFSNHSNAIIRLSAFKYLLNHNESLDINFLTNKINDPELSIRLTSLLAFASEFRRHPQSLKLLQIEKRVEEIKNDQTLQDNDTLREKSYGILFRIIAYANLQQYQEWIRSHLLSQNNLRADALQALGIFGDPEDIPLILHIMHEDESTVSKGRKALKYYDITEITHALETLIGAEQFHLLHQLPDFLAEIPNLNAIDMLLKLTQVPDKSLNRKSVFAIHKIVSQNPLIPINKSLINKLLLEEINYYNDLLSDLELINNKLDASEDKTYFVSQCKQLYENKIDEQLKSIFYLLNIKYPPENISGLFTIFRNQDLENRENAIEYLESLLSPNIKNLLIPLLEQNIVVSPIQHNDELRKIDMRAFENSLNDIKDIKLKTRLLEFFHQEVDGKIA